MPGESLVLGAHLAQQLGPRATLDPSALLCDEVVGQGPCGLRQPARNEESPAILCHRELLKHRVQLWCTCESFGPFEHEHQAWRSAVGLHRDRDTRRRVTAEHPARLLRCGHGDPRGGDGVEPQRFGEAQELVAGLDDRGLVLDDDCAELDHCEYLTTTQDASSCHLPKRCTTPAATVYGVSVRRRGTSDDAKCARTPSVYMRITS